MNTSTVTAKNAYLMIGSLRDVRPELVHFAGAAHRDRHALLVLQEYQRDQAASEPELRKRARIRIYGR